MRARMHLVALAIVITGSVFGYVMLPTSGAQFTDNVPGVITVKVMIPQTESAEPTAPSPSRLKPSPSPVRAAPSAKPTPSQESKPSPTAKPASLSPSPSVSKEVPQESKPAPEAKKTPTPSPTPESIDGATPIEEKEVSSEMGS